MPRLLLLFLVAFLAGAASAAMGQKETALCPSVGDWEPINNLNDTRTVAIGNFSVHEHNRQSNDMLVYQKLWNGRTLSVMSTTIYDLTLTASNNSEPQTGNADDMYEALVYHVSGERVFQLMCFEPVITFN